MTESAILHGPDSRCVVIACSQQHGGAAVKVHAHHGGVAAHQGGPALGVAALRDFPDLDLSVRSGGGKATAGEVPSDRGDFRVVRIKPEGGLGWHAHA